MGSLRTRLTLWVFVIVAGAVAIVTLSVLASLEDALRQQALRDLSRSAHRYSAPIDRAIDRGETAGRIGRLVREASDQANARVTLLGVAQTPNGPETYPRAGTAGPGVRDLQFQVALDAARTRHTATGIESGAAGRVGEAALPLVFMDPRTHRRTVGSVLVYSAPLNGAHQQAQLIRNRALTAAAIALLAGFFAALMTARTVSWRVRRLERAAARVAAGDITARFPVDSPDELGRLARTLDDMRRQLEELDSARKRFIAIASHELRTPLFSLGGFLELLEDEELDEDERRRFVGQLREQVTRMQKLATDLLDLSKLEAGSLELRVEPTDLGDVARLVAAEFEPALHAHESHLELRLPPEPLEVECDPERVAQVMRILIDNSLTHTPPGTDMVVSASRRDGIVR